MQGEWRGRHTVARDWESQFDRWASPPSQTEQQKAENAVRAVRAAINGSQALSGRALAVFAQGSYRNRTNVRAESDVDVCVQCSDSFYYDLPDGTTPAQFGFVSPATYLFPQFQADVKAALVAHFGAASVRAGTKAFDIHANTYRIDADVLPCFEYRRYQAGVATPVLGTAFMSGGGRIHNYPQQHYDSGVAKNTATSQRFKRLARILKNLRCEMLESDKAPSARRMASFLLESLAWNVPDNLYVDQSNVQLVRSVLIYLYNSTETDEKCASWLEVNGIKYLFHPIQPWKREDVRQFLADAWVYTEMT
jgi:hypothetical protein